jgi:acyl-CoA reductase-like NAD-dependent aldehyde dehydrogenase
MNSINIISPLTLEKLYSIQESSNEELQKKFDNSRKAAHEIKNLSVKERVKQTKRLTKVILSNMDLILDGVIAETGKSRSDAIVGEIFTVLDTIEYLNKEAEKILKKKKVKTPIAMMGKKSEIWFEPYGVSLIISPWNYPVTQFFVPVLFAFVAGNSVIYKPSEHTPLMGLMEKLLDQANFPPNYVQIIYGSGVTGQKIIDLRPDKIHFTGSARTGKKIMEQASKYLIPIDLELGGKDPAIVFADANLKRTVAGIIWGSLTNTGQSCTSIERLYVEETIYSTLVSELEKELSNLTLGTGENDDIGTMTPEFQIAKVEEHIDDAIAKGAKIITGGKRTDSNRILRPTLIVDVNSSMKIFSDETFGPIIAVVPFNSEEEVIVLANDSSYGLSATIWTQDLDRARRISEKLEVGNVCINNVMTNEGNPYLPFGGYKESGFGRLKGEVGLIGFCNIKSVLIDKSSDKLEVNWYPYTEKKYKLLRKFISSMYSTNPLKLLIVLYRGLKLEREAQNKRE